MSTEETDKGGKPPIDAQFTLPEDPYANLPGLEEAARKFAHAGVAGDAHAQRAEKVITEADLLPIEAAVTAICMAAGVPPAEKDAIIKDLRSSLGAPKSELGKIMKEAKDFAQKAATDAIQSKTETPEHKVERLWKEIRKIDEEIKSDLESLHKRGLLSDEEYERLKKQRTALDQLDLNDPKRQQGEREYNEAVKKAAKEAENRAESKNDNEGKDTAKRTHNKTEEKEKLQNEYLEAFKQDRANKMGANKDEAAASAREAVEKANIEKFMATSPQGTEGKVELEAIKKNIDQLKQNNPEFKAKDVSQNDIELAQAPNKKPNKTDVAITDSL